MADWPISISEAARRLDIPLNAASVMVRSHGIPTFDTENNNAKGLMPEGFETLRRVSLPFVRSERRKRSGAAV